MLNVVHPNICNEKPINIKFRRTLSPLHLCFSLFCCGSNALNVDSSIYVLQLACLIHKGNNIFILHDVIK